MRRCFTRLSRRTPPPTCRTPHPGTSTSSVFIPAQHRIEVDTVSTWGQYPPSRTSGCLATLAEPVPRPIAYGSRGPCGGAVKRRVAHACRAQVSLRDVLLGHDTATVKATDRSPADRSPRSWKSSRASPPGSQNGDRDCPGGGGLRALCRVRDSSRQALEKAASPTFATR